LEGGDESRLLKSDKHRGKLKSFVPQENLENSLYQGASLKAVLPVVYIYVYLFLKVQLTYIPAGVSCISFLLIRVFQNLLV
jgi:hypothetical protein